MYSIDDGSGETGIGSYGGIFPHDASEIFLNSYTVVSGGENVTQVSVVFGDTAADSIANGSPATIHVWDDPTDAVLLTSTATTVSATGTDTFINVAITPTLVTNIFFVGFQIDALLNISTAFTTLDQSSPINDRSWFSGYVNGGPADPNNISASAFFGTIEGLGLSGNWLIRAQGNPVSAIPVPPTVALLAIGIAAIQIRRLKK